MRGVDAVLALRAATRPIVASWKIEEMEAQGSLTWQGGEPTLTPFLNVDENSVPSQGDPPLPLFAATAPPTQATIIGIVPQFGMVTLERCARYNVHSVHDARFLPTTFGLVPRKPPLMGVSLVLT